MNINYILEKLILLKTTDENKLEVITNYYKEQPIEVKDNTQKILTIKNIDKEQEIIEIKQVAPSSLFYDFKKNLGLQDYTDGSFILYFFFVIFGIQKLNDLFTFVKNILILPKQVTETYNFITKEDLILVDKLDNLMNQLLGVIGADRIAIAKIHNGTYDNTGSHQMKFSMVYEVISNRVKSDKNNVQNISIDYVKDEIGLGCTTQYQKIDRSNLDSPCDLYLDKLGLSTKYYKLLAINNHIYGIIEIHLINFPDEDFLTNKSLKKRVYTINSQMEDCIQSIILKRTWIQKIFSNIFKINPLFK